VRVRPERNASEVTNFWHVASGCVRSKQSPRRRDHRAAQSQNQSTIMRKGASSRSYPPRKGVFQSPGQLRRTAADGDAAAPGVPKFADHELSIRVGVPDFRHRLGNVVRIDRRRHHALRNIDRLPVQIHSNRRLLPVKTPLLVPDVLHSELGGVGDVVVADLRRIGSLPVTVACSSSAFRWHGSATGRKQSLIAWLRFGSLDLKMFQFL
jgi:hypothetical protein